MEDASGGASGGEASTSEGSGGQAASAERLRLEPVDGWVEGASNSLGIRGAMFAAADRFSYDTLVPDFVGSRACASGVVAKVDLTCDPAPGQDCFAGQFGAFIALNLNQQQESEESYDPQPFDASAITGFAFEVEGALVPRLVRFELETDQSDQDPVYCEQTTGDAPASGPREVRVERLAQQCYAGSRAGERVTSVLSRALRLRWHVVSNDRAEVPFDFCVKNLRVLTD